MDSVGALDTDTLDNINEQANLMKKQKGYCHVISANFAPQGDTVSSIKIPTYTRGETLRFILWLLIDMLLINDSIVNGTKKYRS